VFAVKSTTTGWATLLLAAGSVWWLARSRRFEFVWLAAAFPIVFYFLVATTSG
jgi:hypothetical protein